MMQSAPILFLVCLYLYQCNGAPPKEDDTKVTKPHFSINEDDFLVEELSLIPADQLEKMASNNLWEHMADKHRQKREQKIHGFSKARTAHGLRARFRRITDYKNTQVNSKIPDHLLKAGRPDLNRSSRGPRVPYTAAEEKFLIQELSRSSSGAGPLAESTLEAIRVKHDQKREAQTPQFENERTIGSLRCYVEKLKQNKKLPEEIMKKFRIYHKGASTSNPTSEDQQNDLEMSEDDDE